MPILYGLLALILLPIALLLILLGFVWAVNGVIYLITFIIVGAVLGLIDFSDSKRSFEDFWTHTVVMSGILALLPIVVLCINTMSSEITIPSNTASWSCGFYALNWFAFVSGSLYAINTCLVLMLMKIINKFFVGFVKDLKWGLAYLITILQITIAGFVIKSAIAQNDFYDRHLYLATIPILELSLLFVFIIVIYKIIKVLTVKSPSDSLYLQGDDLYKHKQYNEALNYYEQAYNANASTADYYFYAKGTVHYAKKDYEEALSCLNNALPKIKKQRKKEYLALIETVEKEYADGYYKQALNLKDSAEFGKAIKIIEKAIDLVPNNKDYENLLSELQKLYDEEKAKINDVYDNAVKLTKEKEYEKALKLVKNGISLARKQNVYTGKFNALKKEITSYIDKLEQAKEKYDIAMSFYNKKDYSNAILNLENIISLVPDEDLYIKRLAEIKQEWDNKQAQAENLYIEAKNYFQNNDLNNAKSSVNKALRLIKDNKYTTLKKDIEREQENIVKEQEAEKLYKEAEKLYGAKNINYKHIIELLNSAINKYPKTKYQDLLKKVKSERDTVEAENLYKKAKKDFENKDYDSAISSISEAIKLIPSNRMYIDLKQKISWEQQEYETNQKAEQSYKAGLKAYNNGDFATAVDNLTKACNMKPDNEEWKNLLEKVKSGKIDIMCCTKRGLLSLEFIDNEKAEQIINARNDGDKWYNYEEFAQAFEIMPHLYPDIEEKISFPLKQGNQYGRRVES